MTFLALWTLSAHFLATLQRHEVNESIKGKEVNEEHNSGHMGTLM